jgi:hypothetical protein
MRELPDSSTSRVGPGAKFARQAFVSRRRKAGILSYTSGRKDLPQQPDAFLPDWLAKAPGTVFEPNPDWASKLCVVDFGTVLEGTK